MAVMDTIRMLLFDHGCAIFLWEEWFMLAMGAPGHRAHERRGYWAVWCGWLAGKQHGAVMCSCIGRLR